jgi:adenosylcobinamide-GDP ribazoletransferase
VNGLRIAFAFMTRIPVGQLEDVPDGSLARAAVYFPIVGAVVGALGGLALWLAIFIGLPPVVAAGIGLGATILLIGALHEDGLADAADGLGLIREPARTLEIMRDSHIGTFGVLALIFSIGLRWSAITLLTARSPWFGAVVMTCSGAVSRAYLPAMMAMLPPVRRDGLGHGAGRPTMIAVVGSIFLAAVSVLILEDVTLGVSALLAPAAALFLFSLFVKARLGGQTGDILGAGQQLAEVSVLLTILAIVGGGA